MGRTTQNRPETDMGSGAVVLLSKEAELPLILRYLEFPLAGRPVLLGHKVVHSVQT